MYVPETKRLGMMRDIDDQLAAAREGRRVCREEVERLVGRTSHVAQVAAEGNAFLKPLYRLEKATHRVTKSCFKKGELVERRKMRVRPRWIQVGSSSVAAKEYRVALEWWRATLEAGVAVPLAPRLVFPQVGEEGCLFVFTDAARESGTGFGGFTVVEEGPSREAKFLFVEQRWGGDTLRRLQKDEWSMPAGEMFGAAMIVAAAVRRLKGVTHVVCFSDSVSTAKAVTSGSSAAPQLNVIVRQLHSWARKTQMIGVHQPGVRNGVSDKLSRGRLLEVLASLRASKVQPERLPLVEGWATLMRESQYQPTRNAD